MLVFFAQFFPRYFRSVFHFQTSIFLLLFLFLRCPTGPCFFWVNGLYLFALLFFWVPKGERRERGKGGRAPDPMYGFMRYPSDLRSVPEVGRALHPNPSATAIIVRFGKSLCFWCPRNLYVKSCWVLRYIHQRARQIEAQNFARQRSNRFFKERKYICLIVFFFQPGSSRLYSSLPLPASTPAAFVVLAVVSNRDGVGGREGG